MRRPRICVIGSSNYDLTTFVPRLPGPGETLRGTGLHMGFGGKGANQAVMAARLGARVSIVTKLGRDVFGEDTLKNFRSLDIDTRHVLFADRAASGVATITVDPEGRNSIVVSPGANDLLSEDDVERARDAIRAADVAVCQLEVPVATTLRALRVARAEGVLTVLNPAPAADLPAECYRLCDLFCPNESETEALTGLRVETIEEAEAAGRNLIGRGSRTVVVTLGERGSLVVTSGESSHIPAPTVEAVDTTGAGDAFVGSLACFAAAGLSVNEAASRANRIAARSVLAAGTQSSFPAASELPEELLHGVF